MRFSFALIFLIMTSMATGCVTQNEHGICEDNTDIMWTTPKSKEVSSVPIDGAYTATTRSKRRTFRAMLDNIGQALPMRRPVSLRRAFIRIRPQNLTQSWMVAARTSVPATRISTTPSGADTVPGSTRRNF